MSSDGFVCMKSNAMPKAFSNFSSGNIGNVFKLSSVAFRLAQPYGGLLVGYNFTHRLSIVLICYDMVNAFAARLYYFGYI